MLLSSLVAATALVSGSPSEQHTPEHMLLVGPADPTQAESLLKSDGFRVVQPGADPMLRQVRASVTYEDGMEHTSANDRDLAGRSVALRPLDPAKWFRTFPQQFSQGLHFVDGRVAPTLAFDWPDGWAEHMEAFVVDCITNGELATEAPRLRRDAAALEALVSWDDSLYRVWIDPVTGGPWMTAPLSSVGFTGTFEDCEVSTVSPTTATADGCAGIPALTAQAIGFLSVWCDNGNVPGCLDTTTCTLGYAVVSVTTTNITCVGGTWSRVTVIAFCTGTCR